MAWDEIFCICFILNLIIHGLKKYLRVLELRQYFDVYSYYQGISNSIVVLQVRPSISRSHPVDESKFIHTLLVVFW